MKIKKDFFIFQILIILVFTIFASSCKKDVDQGKIPVLSTIEVTSITQITARCGGIITSNGGLLVTARGVCWSTSENPTIAENKTSDEIEKDSSKLDGLTAGTTYYVRAYATNSKGTGYGNTLVFQTFASTFTDPRDGNVYKIVTIWDQLWMAENLKYLPRVDSLAAISIGAPYYFVYGYDGTDANVAKATANYATYGVLYNWEAAMISPPGWHLPSMEEWLKLREYLDSGAITGFDFTLGGCRYYSITYGRPAQFGDIGGRGVWWSSTKSNPYLLFSWRWIYSGLGSFSYNGSSDEQGLSVRYVKN